jgi:hypothetical protein
LFMPFSNLVLPPRRGLDSMALVGRLENSEGSLGYAANLSMMHQLISRGPRSAGESIRLGSLRAKYREVRIERQGQQELL